MSRTGTAVVLAAITVVLALEVSGCGKASNSTPSIRGPQSIAVDGDPNGLYWDAAEQTLYMADNENNRILQYTDAKGISVAAPLPTAPASGVGLGGIIRLANGMFVTARFGYGTDGAILYTTTAGSMGIVPNLDPTRKRIGLAVDASGNIYDTWFEGSGTTAVGAVSVVELSGAENQILGGYGKPVGVLSVGTNLLISDQLSNEVYLAAAVNSGAQTVFATLTSPDLLTPGPNESYFTGGPDGDLDQIDAAGNVTTFASGFQEVRGVAYDPVNQRVFFADHNPTTGATEYLQILPVN